MLRTSAARAISMALAVAFNAMLPVAVNAQASPAPAPSAAAYHYSTSIAPVYGSQYPLAGHLDLEIFPNGIVRGYYHNAFQKAYISVTGGRDGSYLWFDIGPSLVNIGLGVGPGARIHVVATMDSDNSFRGQAYPAAQASDFASTNVAINGGDAQNVPNFFGPEPPQQYTITGKAVDASSEDYAGPGH